MSTSYGQFCPVSMAAEIVCSRWTMLVIRELLCGSTRFNELRRGVPRMSPALLSRRLKELEQAWPKKRLMYQQQLEREGEEIRKAKRSLRVIEANPEHFRKVWKREEQAFQNREREQRRGRGDRDRGWSR